MTAYAKQLLARRALRMRAQAQPFHDSSKIAVRGFRAWEAGFIAHEHGFSIDALPKNDRKGREGWLAAAKVDEFVITGEVKNVHDAVIEKLFKL